MRKFTLILLLAFGMCVSVFAQSRDIEGVVVSSSDNKPVVGAMVIVEGTTKGAITDPTGKFVITSVSGNVNLEASFLGFEAGVVPVAAAETKVTISLKPDALAVDEVVVTGLGITRAKKALGYSVQEVEGEELSKVRTSNVVGALSGRVAGVQITQASGQLGGGAKINIRGNTSLTGNNQPLFVVDGMPISNSDNSSDETGTNGATGGGGYDLGNMAGDLNSDDIESMTVLKGASATAIYGSRGANGVVLITTKKGAKGDDGSFGISINSQVTIDKAAYIPKLQQSYGGGYSDDGFSQVTINGQTYNVMEYYADESWGPKFDANTKVLMWNNFDPEFPNDYLNAQSWVYPENDYTTYFQTGVGTTNNISMQKATDKYSFRLSYTNLKQTGITPNSELLRHTVAFNGTTKLNDYVDAFASVNFVDNRANGRPETGYGDRNPVQKMWQWCQTNLDYSDLREYVLPGTSTQRSWNRTSWSNSSPAYTDNPYWSVYENYQNDSRTRVYGNAGVNINILRNLKFTGRVGVDTYDFTNEERMAVGSQATSSYELQQRSSMESNIDAFMTYNTRFSDDKFGLTAMVGTSSNDRQNSLAGGYTSGGLVVPGVYNLSNSAAKATVYDAKYHRRTNSVYGNATLDYNQLLYLDFTARNDWSSTLPVGSNSYFYPSVNLGLILTQLGSLKDIEWLSFAKLRAGWAQVGNDTNEYVLANYYETGSAFNGNPMYELGSTLNNSTLLPEMTKSWEIGLEAMFLNNRLGFDVSYYQKQTVNQIVPVTVSAATGYTSSYINAGEMMNKGLEVTINAAPVRSESGFNWDLQLNLATLDTRVIEITDGVNWISLGGGPFNVETGAFTGMIYPSIYGTDYVYDDNGNRLIDPDTGLYQTSGATNIGNVTPTFTAGLSNTFTYKGFDLNILFDMQLGGHMYYTSYMWGMYSGMLDESAAPSNAGSGDIREDGIILDGVLPDGRQNNIVVDGYDYCYDLYTGPDAQSVFKTDFLKLREVRLGYTFPSAWTGPIKSVRLSAFGRNLATFLADTQHFDPEYLQSAGSNAQGIEGGYIPTTRTFGFSLSFNF